MQFQIDTNVIEKFPHLIANIVIIKNFTNNPSQEIQTKILTILRESEDSLRTQFTDKESLFTHPYITSYFDLFRTFGVNPKKVKPSHAALTERVIKGGSLPDINPAVNLYNAFSVKYITPFGGEDLDKIDPPFELTIATGNEEWLGIGETQPISPKTGDLIWKDQHDVSTLSLNWRQSEKTKLEKTSKNGYFIMEGFDNINQENIINTGDFFIKSFTALLGGEGTAILLSKDSVSFSI